jgi:prepilin-type N-terminal cleavage/methylation domain-containing protein
VVRRLAASRRGGFTLIEVMVTIAVMGLMLAGITQILSSVRFARDIIHNEQEQYLAGPAILDQMERDLLAIFVTGIPLADHLKIENKVVGGADADRIDFFSSTNSLLWTDDGGRKVRADVNEVGYCLRPNPTEDDFLELYRREGFGIDRDPHEGGRYIFLHDRVRGLNIEVFGERGPEDVAEPLEEWGQDRNDPDTQGLPAYIRITLEIELEPRLLQETLLYTKQLKTYTRIVSLPEALRYEKDGDVPRLSVPTGGGSGDDGQAGPGSDAVAGDGSGNGNGGGGGGGNGGGGGGNSGGGSGVIDGSRTGGGQ